MPLSFFAFCLLDGEPMVKRLSVHREVQDGLEELFDVQERMFRDGIQDSVEFTGDWKPDEDEFLFVNIPDQIRLWEETITGAPLAVPTLDAENFAEEGVKALFTGRIVDGQPVVLIQKFTPQQLLSRKFALILSNNTLNELTDPAFTLDNKLVAIIEGGRLNFKSYHNIRMIFDLSALYRAATDGDIEEFASHDCLDIPDMDGFKMAADQTARKLVHAIQRDAVLDQHTAEDIQRRAQTVGLVINVHDGRVQIPADRAEIKRILRFLHDDIYEAPLSQLRYVTNSKKPE